ncbi:hypothetical protein [Agromyces laixinhei]|uniref:hypothetical protein n=1 Tax=Agromyces laixinhei TaxID=2585717 RepID=UPI0018DB9D40|nr:hypothetical protein [Agromyces laixinhei]
MSLVRQPDEAKSVTAAEWTVDDADADFAHGYVDVDEWREAPVRHRYIDGGFTGTETRFSYYFPESDRYEGRFFQHVTPVPQSENLAPTDTSGYNKISFSVGSGAYFVETNGGGPDAANPMSGNDPSIGAYRASAAAARFSRAVAQQIYGREHRPYGYLYGGSGGAYRTIGSSESTEGVWDGFAPYVPGSPMSIPNVFSVRMHAQRVLRDAFPRIVDAYDVGGDPESLQLTDEERAALDEVTRMGFPPRSWFGWKTMGMHAFSVLYPGVMAADPTYAEDFWTADGYLGADAVSSVHRDRVRLQTSIVELITDAGTEGPQLNAGGVDESFLNANGRANVPSAVRLAEAPEGWILGAQLIVRSGTAAGAVIRLSSVDGDLGRIEPGQDEQVTALAIGDEVTVDNSSFLAAQTYHRHQVPSSEYTVWDQFRATDGSPVPPQRPFLLGPSFTQSAAGTLPTGKISGKMIVVACLLDREAFPWQADWYRSRVTEHLATRSTTDSGSGTSTTRSTARRWSAGVPRPYRGIRGCARSALRQLATWVEDGVEPVPSSSYEVVDGQVVIPEGAAARGGVQPVDSLTVNGAPSTSVRAGEPVTVELSAEAPRPGVIVEVRPDFAATGLVGESAVIAPGSTVSLHDEQVFADEGTYFLSARVTAQAEGDAASPHARVENVVRARVTVAA